MTDQHPLTDDICEDLSSFIKILTAPWGADPYICPQYVANDMRAAADWQLEEVIKWLNETIFERGSCLEAVNIPEELAEAMRPTKTQEKAHD